MDNNITNNNPGAPDIQLEEERHTEALRTLARIIARRILYGQWSKTTSNVDKKSTASRYRRSDNEGVS